MAVVPPESPQDRNFDDLAERFERKIYGGLKGRIRLAVLERDFARQVPVTPFADSVPARPWRVLDAGGGSGAFSLALARAGHSVVICDISRKMLDLAADKVAQEGLEDRVQLVHGSVQSLGTLLPDAQPFDLVLAHALMEWLAEPETLLPTLMPHLCPGGYLSLTFYNRHSLVYRNLLRGNFRKVASKTYRGDPRSLTPLHPLDPVEVQGWLAIQPLEVLSVSGVRVFHDYIAGREILERSPEDLLALEVEYSDQEPYRSLGRYQHVVARRV
ncbi:methyltransferase domain-containing protein [Marinimicrobium alkaliphilum]|uniref:methyltransferase domain-containing protein n=1 Tax=Marinimicrobium alkaliphilum TaxID=2202654 RepID=UPI000DB94686|nr:methyltransferase domain-containing protein [Marinimicrobium alkaliphilum]